MFNFTNYVRAQSLDEAYELYQKRNNVVLGGMLWLKMQDRNCTTGIDLCDLGLNTIEETKEEFRIGAMVSLRQLEVHEGMNAYTGGAMKEALKHIVGVQFRNCATVGGSIWGRYGFSDVMTIFRALDAKVELHKAGVLTLDEFCALPRKTRDILIAVIVPRKIDGIVYLSQRNVSTDFPVLTCAVSKSDKGVVAVIGASPYMAEPVWDEEKLLDHVFAESDKEGSEEKIGTFADYVAERIRFDSNMRAGADYRKRICSVLVRRALEKLTAKTEEE